MKKSIFLLILLVVSSGLRAQHNYDSESVIYSTKLDDGSNSKVGIDIDDPLEKLHVNGNLLLEAYDHPTNISEKGIFFSRPTTNLYGLSILTYKTPGRIRGALGINAMDGIYFNTGSLDQKNTRMFIGYDGKVGIGTETPSEKLELNGNLFLNDGILKIGSTTNSVTAKTALSISSSPTLGQTPVLAINDGNEFGRVSVRGELISLDGNVGIGTSDPLERLDVRGKTVSESMLVNPNGDSGYMLQMGNQFDNDRRHFNFGYSDTGANFVGYSVLTAPVAGIPKAAIAENLNINDRSSIPAPNTDPNYVTRLQFSAKDDVTSIGILDPSGGEIFKAARSGEYGSFIHMPKPDSRLIIGGTGDYLYAEGYKLVVKDGSAKVGGELTLQNQLTIENGGADVKGDVTVAGKILAREVKVDINAGADFVFEDDYNLWPLKEVEEFVAANGHLPEIAPASEMEANGLDLGAMNIKLLQKIEELTLYIIEQEKSIQDQEERLEKLEAFLRQK